jgi:hypothetical protein
MEPTHDNILAVLTHTVQLLAEAQTQTAQQHEQLLHSLAAQQAATASRPTTSEQEPDGTRLGLKPKLPTFRGRLGVDSVAQFTADLVTAFKATGINSNSKRVYIAASCLEDSAKTWWFAQTQKPAFHADRLTWDEFTELLRSQYLPTNYNTMLRERLRQCRQRTSLHGYTTEFSSIAHQITNMSEDDKVFNYIQGLKPQTASWVLTGQPTTLQAAIDRAMQYDSAYFHHGTITQTHTVDSRSRYAKHPVAPDHMELDLTRLHNNTRKVTDTRGARCFNCGQPGHFKRNCPRANHSDQQTTRPSKFRPFGNGQ